MAWNTHRDANLIDDLNLFLDDLCSEWDFCGGVRAKDLFKNVTSIRALDFTRAVLIAEGMKPDNEPNWMRRIKRRFVARYGQTVSVMTHEI